MIILPALTCYLLICYSITSYVLFPVLQIFSYVLKSVSSLKNLFPPDGSEASYHHSPKIYGLCAFKKCIQKHYSVDSEQLLFSPCLRRGFSVASYVWVLIDITAYRIADGLEFAIVQSHGEKTSSFVQLCSELCVHASKCKGSWPAAKRLASMA